MSSWDMVVTDSSSSLTGGGDVKRSGIIAGMRLSVDGSTSRSGAVLVAVLRWPFLACKMDATTALPGKTTRFRVPWFFVLALIT